MAGPTFYRGPAWLAHPFRIPDQLGRRPGNSPAPARLRFRSWPSRTRPDRPNRARGTRATPATTTCSAPRRTSSSPVRAPPRGPARGCSASPTARAGTASGWRSRDTRSRRSIRRRSPSPRPAGSRPSEGSRSELTVADADSWDWPDRPLRRGRGDLRPVRVTRSAPPDLRAHVHRAAARRAAAARGILARPARLRHRRPARAGAPLHGGAAARRAGPRSRSTCCTRTTQRCRRARATRACPPSSTSSPGASLRRRLTARPRLEHRRECCRRPSGRTACRRSRRSSASARSTDIAWRYGRSVVIASNASTTEMMRAQTGISLAA